MKKTIKFAKKRLLLTGGTGFLGRHFSKSLEKNSNFDVKVSVRKICKEISIPHHNQSLIKDINWHTEWSEALQDCDIVVHMAARVHVLKENSQNPLQEFRSVNVGGTINLAQQAVEVGVKRFIYISSIKVNGENTYEDTPFTVDVHQAPTDPYALSKYEAEIRLREIAKKTNMEIVIIRPPMIYGPGVKGNFQRLLNLLVKGYPLPLSKINNKRSFVSVYNLCDLIQCCLTHPNAANQTFLVSDNKDLSTTELIQKMASALQIKPHLFWCPGTILKSCASVLRKSDEVARLLNSLQLDISFTMNRLNWQPSMSVESGLEKTVQQFWG